MSLIYKCNNNNKISVHIWCVSQYVEIPYLILGYSHFTALIIGTGPLDFHVRGNGDDTLSSWEEGQDIDAMMMRRKVNRAGEGLESEGKRLSGSGSMFRE